MPRVKCSVATRKRRKKVLERAKGFVGSKHALFRVANEQVLHALSSAYRDRRRRKRDFRRLWIVRINAAVKINAMTYRGFMHGLKLAKITLNRKMLALLAVEQPTTFAKLVGQVKTHINSV